MNRIKSGKRYPFHTQLLTNALTSGCFSVFFGGSWMDMIASAIIGVLLKFFEAVLKRGSSNGLIVALLCSSFGGLLSNLDQVLRNATGLPVSIAENPLACVVRGTGTALDNLPKFKNVLSTMY